APIKRPSGIFPGANVFQVPPPAVDASAVSGGTLAAGPGEVFTGAASGAPCAGDAAATAGRCGVAALATCIGGADGAGVCCCATTGACEGAAVGAGVALPFASFPRLTAG